MRLRPILYINGLILVLMAAAMLLPAFLDYSHANPDWLAFVSAAAITGFAGFLFFLTNRQEKLDLGFRETFIFTALSWPFIAVFAALPFYLSTLGLSYTSSFFEAMSGITTTSSTVLTGLDTLPHGILAWRAMLQFLGGLSFLVVGMAILPRLQVSGMQLFSNQPFDVEKAAPNALHIAFSLCGLYTVLTLACAASLYSAGMTLFEAFCHSLATISTGGFSTSDASIAHFHSPAIEMILAVFMILGALPFMLYLRMIAGDWRAIVRARQVRGFLAIMGLIAAALTLYLIFTGQAGIGEALRRGLFTAASLLSTTSYISGDYTLWGPLVIGIAFMASFIGGCSGSTASGVKIFRLQILWQMAQKQIRRLLHPHGVFKLSYNNKVITSDVQAAVAGFFFIYVSAWIFFSLALQMTGLDFLTSFTGSIAAISNSGTGIGVIVGPSGNYSFLPPESLWILSAAMLLGRIEFMAFFVILMPGFWKD